MAPRKKQSKAPKKKSESIDNQKLHIETLKRMQKELKDAWSALCRDATKKDVEVFRKDMTRIKLLYGQCEFMADEYRRLAAEEKRISKR